MNPEKDDPHKAVQFFCPEPCEGQILIGGAVIRPIDITLVGQCVNCGREYHVSVTPLLRDMCEFTTVTH